MDSIKNRVYNLSFSNFETIEKFNEFQSSLSVTLNIGPVGLGVSLPKKYKIYIDSIIDALKQIEGTINIHIENLEKIDNESLIYIMEILKSTNNIMFFLECSNDYNRCQYIYDLFSDSLIDVKLIPVDKLDWGYVSRILSDLKLENNEKVKDEYMSLQGDIKRLIFNSKFKVKKRVQLYTESKLLLDFINITNSYLTINEIREMIIKYESLNKRLYSIHQLNYYINNLKEHDLIIEYGKDTYICTNYGKEYSTNDNTDLILQMISVSLLLLLDKPLDNSYANKIDLLILLYLKHNDKRITKLLPYIEKNLLFLKLNSSNIDAIYFLLIKLHIYDVNLMIIIARCFIRLNSYIKAKDVLENYVKDKSNLYDLLMSTVLIHTQSENKSTETYILNAINRCNEFELKSALYTCLLSLYMRTKHSNYVVSYINEFNYNQLTQTDKMIVDKNTSIYFDYPIAKEMLNNSIEYFKGISKSLLIAAKITLATRETQYGNIDNARDILLELYDSSYLSNEDLIYIDNNLSVIDLLNNNLNDQTIKRLNNAYLFCQDEYTHLLICNNLLIYHTLVGELNVANKYANEIENAGFDTYCFDEYIHLTFLNLILFYSKTNNSERINHYERKLLELKKNCQSVDLKEYIDSHFTNDQIEQDKKWHFMSQFKFRPAFIGHWIINYFDC